MSEFYSMMQESLIPLGTGIKVVFIVSILSLTMLMGGAFRD